MLARHPILFVALCALFILALAETAEAKPSGSENVAVHLTRPLHAVDGEAHGMLRLKAHGKSGRQRFDLKIHRVDAALAHELHVERTAGVGDYAFVAMLEPQGKKNMVFSVDTKDGDPLPLGVDSIAEYSGCRVAIIQGGVAILGCLVPEVNEPGNPGGGNDNGGGNGNGGSGDGSGDDDGGGDGDGSGDDPGADGDGSGDEPGDGDDDDGGRGDAVPATHMPLKARVKLRPPEVNAPVPAMKGKLRLRARKNDHRQRVRLNVKRAPFDEAELAVFVEQPRGSGEFVDVGELERKGNSLKGRYQRNTRRGDPLPMGVDTLVELGGRTVQIRDDAGLVYLVGEIPDFDG